MWRSGTLDAGITGKDWTQENAPMFTSSARWFIPKPAFGRRAGYWQCPTIRQSRKSKISRASKVSTEMVNFTKRYFAERQIPVEVEFSWGATEAKAAEGLVDAIVEVTETGSTIRAHGLKIIHELDGVLSSAHRQQSSLAGPLEASENRADQTATCKARSRPRTKSASS